ncbi:radical SAM family heme chaperone HemW [Flavobacterium subsaxonicum]|uniref:Heme chaperone HemW n=1 Tax=Flavobacterium subsaxonicum WB 4.1-42 = DSM 21790 TaxID=1121898 RepID=A0A0A2MF21_9FLAO|nr:radical SAM family heme chaperone HemW [Flavobacterium subsaxonicum]KGO90894.1 coproporphyrinogen III oxidase [Flavobacterium subsaxonicum WB 4.1-42 = DSM 21790]
MAGIYIHIPFCRQACHYCDFHFSTSTKKQGEMVLAIAKEIAMRKGEFAGQTVETIYFGGGTPSVLSNAEIQLLIAAVYHNYTVGANPEITLEANPDDLSPSRIVELSNSPINRLSIGIQSFFEEDLKLMNRAHNALEAEACLAEAVKHFDNISIDLIYGTPGMSNERWLHNVNKALAFGVPHISSYALTVEPKTALYKFVKSGAIAQPSDEVAQEQFMLLVDTLQEHGFVHYELSNFGKEGYFSKNNTAYWLGKKYIGIGPSAHSYDGVYRSWNIANNALYLKAIEAGEFPSEKEKLTIADRYNEYVMTGLRTIWGVSVDRVEAEFGNLYKKYLLTEAAQYIAQGLLSLENGVLKTTREGKFLADGLASDLFFINLD